MVMVVWLVMVCALLMVRLTFTSLLVTHYTLTGSVNLKNNFFFIR